MKKRANRLRKWVLGLMTAASFFTTACDRDTREQNIQERVKNQVMHLNLSVDPPSLDPGVPTDTLSNLCLGMLFEGLTRFGPDCKIQPAVAKSWELSNGNKRYTFHLRPSKWSNGDPVTAYDFVYAWRRAAAPGFLSRSASEYLALVKNARAVKEGHLPAQHLGVRALDDYTLEVDLENPSPYFLEMLSYSPFWPVNSSVDRENNTWANQAEGYVSNGPFFMESWERGNRMVFEKNPFYWSQDSVRLNKVVWFEVADQATQLKMFENGELDWLGKPLMPVPLDALPTLKTKAEVGRSPSSGSYWYIFNNEEAPFNNAKMRKAFALAIDRNTIIREILMEDHLPAFSPIPPEISLLDSQPYQDFQPELALQFFEEALEEMGLSREELPKVVLGYNTLQSHHRIAQYLQKLWEDVLGVKVELKNSEWGVYLDRVYSKEFQIAKMGWEAGYHDPLYFLEIFGNDDQGVFNAGGWNDEEYKECLRLARQESDEDLREDYLRRAEEILVRDLPVAPIYYFGGETHLAREEVHGVQQYRVGTLDLREAYLK